MYSAAFGADIRIGDGDKCSACDGTCPLARSSFNTCFAVGDNLEYSAALAAAVGDDAPTGDTGPLPNDGDLGFLGDGPVVAVRHLSFKSTFDRIDSVDAYFASLLIFAHCPTPCSATPAASARVSASLHVLYNLRLFFLFYTASKNTHKKPRRVPSVPRRIAACAQFPSASPTPTPPRDDCD